MNNSSSSLYVKQKEICKIRNKKFKNQMVNCNRHPHSSNFKLIPKFLNILIQSLKY